MGNIYIKPTKDITNDTGLTAFMRDLLKKYCGDDRTIKHRGDMDNYPYIRADKRSVALHLDTFYSILCIDGLFDPVSSITLDTVKYGEKPYEDILEDLKTAVNYINSDPEEEYNE